ncbi:MAG: T9SS type A sorting domain-containing protein [Bacteroidota bacterium]
MVRTIKQMVALVLFVVSSNAYGQYLETFSTPNKGILAGTCSGTEASCTSDFVGVDWTINGDFSGMDGNDFFATDGSGRFNADGDNDASEPGLCFETPVLDISAVAGSVSFSVELDWVSWDFTDICDVEYQIDGGIWNQVPPLPDTDGPGTVDFNSDSNTDSGTATVSGISGSTLSIRVCLQSNSSFDDIFIDNVSVPEIGAVVLPVKWADINVKTVREGNKLNWATYTEVNNERFEIEKSINNTNSFRKIGTVDGSGTTIETSRYEFIDREISNATAYYRIKQVDFDGHFEYSEIVVAKTELKDRIRFSPNPFTSQLLISMNSNDLVEGTAIRMFNNQGQLVMQRKITSLNLDDPINTENLIPGMYSIQFDNGEVIRLVKF